MNWIARELSSHKVPGVYSVPEGTDAVDASAAAALLGLRFFHIDGSGVLSTADFLKVIAEAMDFPDYFGHNWDALDECIRDLAWAPAKGYLVLYQGAQDFATKPAQFQIALQVFHWAVEHWNGLRVPMYILIQGTPVSGPSLKFH